MAARKTVAGTKVRPRRTGRSSRPSRKPGKKLGRYRRGYETGYREGVQTGIQSFPVRFEGTSIVIPSYNQAGMTRQCIESIIRHTHVPYEIIVVDNASTDGTDRYLKKTGGRVRYRILDENRGFAGAINVGMMMAKGSTILLLNNDTVVAERWLDNLLHCLYSDERIGIVGPITNYIGSIQLVDVPYKDVSDMPAFANANNVPDPSRWQETDQLVGFCMLFRRRLFEGIGYFDEGFEIGNYEDNDFNLRTRLLGLKLMIARDSFIHHYGSVSMRMLGDRLPEVNHRNSAHFTNKWLDAYSWLDAVRARPELQAGPLADASSYCPERVAVRGIGAQAFWIEGGQRRPVHGIPSFEPVRVSQIDLRRWPVGDPISAEEAESRWRGSDNALGVGLARTPDGTLYHVEGDRLRLVYGDAALRSWGLQAKPVGEFEAERLAWLPVGLPIVAAPVLKQKL